MSAMFGKGNILDPLGISTSKAFDPLGITGKVMDKGSKVIDPLDLNRKAGAKLDYFGMTDVGAQAKGYDVNPSSGGGGLNSIKPAKQDLLGD